MKKRRVMVKHAVVVVRCDGCGVPVGEVKGSVVAWMERHLRGCHAWAGVERGSGDISRSEVVHYVSVPAR